jgi:asparagine synthase (glutamine-hydrolysing)
MTVWHLTETVGFRWPTLAEGGGVTAISLGIPVSAPTTGGPLGMARRLLAGEDVHATVVPPFGLVAQDVDGRVVIQQDWLGHCRLFTATAGGITGFSNRPSLLATLLTGCVRPSQEGWESYALAGHFGESTSAIEDVRLLHPGERVTCRRVGDAGWSTAHETRFAADDVVRAGVAARDGGVESALDMAAAAFRRTIASLDDLYDAEISLGLSGGKDSRLMAAVFVAAGRMPNFFTNGDTAAEGETARRLVEIIGQTRHMYPRHTVGHGVAAKVLDVGLVERTTRLQRHYDFQFPSSYLARPAVARQLPATLGGISINGAAGELATGYWYPADPDAPREDMRAHLFSTLLNASGPDVAAPAATERQRLRVAALLDHAATLGLDGHEQADYLYLIERMRRWATSAYRVGMVVPFLTPDVVAATFALTAEDKRSRRLHNGLLRRFVGEWVDVPYVSVSTGRSHATRVWQGDGLVAVRRLLDRTSAHGIAGLVQTEAVRVAVRDCAHGAGSTFHRRTIEQYVALAVASNTLEPATTRLRLATAMRSAQTMGLIPAQRLARKAARRVIPRPAKIR